MPFCFRVDVWGNALDNGPGPLWKGEGEQRNIPQDGRSRKKIRH